MGIIKITNGKLVNEGHIEQKDILIIDDPREPIKVTRLDTKQSISWARDEQGAIVIDIDPTHRSLLVDVLEINW